MEASQPIAGARRESENDSKMLVLKKGQSSNDGGGDDDDLQLRADTYISPITIHLILRSY